MLVCDLTRVGSPCTQQLRGKQRLLRKPAPLTISGVFDVMRKISIEQGSGSNNRKRSHVLNLLRAAQGPETNFIVRCASLLSPSSLFGVLYSFDLAPGDERAAER
jgi:ATP-dependent DNA ligase